MIFVHLTDIRNADKIRKSGLLLGNRNAKYSYGEGVFCVPAVLLNRYDQGRERKRYPDGSWQELVQQARPAGTGLMWKWWTKFKGIRRPAAVYFRVPKRLWPADLFIYVEPDQAVKFALECKKQGVFPPDSKFRESTPDVELELRPQDEAHLGRLLAIATQVGLTLRSWPSGIDLQVVFRRPIPATCIRRIVPLSQKNVDFKKRKTGKKTIERGVRSSDGYEEE